MAHGTEELDTEEQGVTWNNLATELHTVDLEEVGRPFLRVFELAEDEEASTLCHGFDLQHTRHDGFLWEVALEERLIGGDILHAYDGRCPHGNDFVHKLHGIAVGQKLADADIVHQRLLIGVVDRSLYFVLTDLLAHQTGKLIVDRVAGACGDDTTFDRLADERHVTDDVEQLMARALVVPLQGSVLDVAYLCGIDMWHMEKVGKLVELSLLHLLLVDDDCVVEVTPFDEVGLKQRHYIADKDKSACRCYVGSKLIDVVKCSKL